MTFKKLLQNRFFWIFAGYFNILTSFLLIFYVFHFNFVKDLTGGFLGGFFVEELTFISLIVEVPILLLGISVFLFKKRLIKLLALAAFSVQLLIVVLLLIPFTRSKLLNFNSSGTQGNTIKWTNSVPAGIFKTDYKAPIINFKSPVNYFCFIEIEGCGNVSGEVPISVEVTDNVGVKDVRIYADEAILKEFTEAPYEVTWDATYAAKGSHTIRVIAEDISGNNSDFSVEVFVK